MLLDNIGLESLKRPMDSRYLTLYVEVQEWSSAYSREIKSSPLFQFTSPPRRHLIFLFVLQRHNFSRGNVKRHPSGAVQCDQFVGLVTLGRRSARRAADLSRDEAGPRHVTQPGLRVAIVLGNGARLLSTTNPVHHDEPDRARAEPRMSMALSFKVRTLARPDVVVRGIFVNNRLKKKTTHPPLLVTGSKLSDCNL